MTLSEAQINEKIQEEGAIRVLATFEVAGKPKKHVEETLTTYIDKLKEDEAIDVLNVHREKAVELEDEESFFSAFAEVEMLLAELEDLLHLCINLMPASVEILAPDYFEFEARELQNWNNDLLSRLHEIAQTVRTERQKAAYLNKNIHGLLINFVHVLLVSGPKGKEELARMTGVDAQGMDKLLNDMKEQELVREEDGKWVLHKQQK